MPRSLTAILLACFCLVPMLAGCGGGGSSDGDIVDGDLPDGDASDGDTQPDGDQADGDAEKEYPDHTFFFAPRNPAVTAPDEPYWIDEPVLYRTTDTLPDLDVRALIRVMGDLFAGTGSGLVVWNQDDDRFDRFLASEVACPVLDLAMSGDGRLLAACGDEVLVIDTVGGTVDYRRTFGPAQVTSLAADGTDVLIGGTHGILRTGLDLAGDTLVYDRPVRDLAVGGSGAAVSIWAATVDGLVEIIGGNIENTISSASLPGLPDSIFHAVARCEDDLGVIGVTSQAAVTVTGPQSLVTAVLPGKGSIPAADFTAVHCNGSEWIFGHAIGGSYLGRTTGAIDHYVSLRWLPDNNVTAVLLDGSGNRWFATPAGIARITLVERTFAGKAAYFEEFQDDHFWRMDGFVPSDVSVDDPWNPTVWKAHDKDNDGLWTQMQIGAWCFAYAETGDDYYYQKAKKAMQNMLFEVDITEADFTAAGLGYGFVTRSIVREDEGDVYTSKTTQDNWHPVTWSDSRHYYWKDDTSSDEINGHMFGFPLYYDLCAKDEAERAEVARRALGIVDFIMRGNYFLLDLDGEKTTHGHWAPTWVSACIDGTEYCQERYGLDAVECLEACLSGNHGGGWLNGMEIIGSLLAAWHLSGDTKYYDAYEDLLIDHRYAEMIDFSDEIYTVTKPEIANHSDHELAILAYHTLIRYEPNEDRRNRWIASLRTFLQKVADERNPFEMGLAAMFTPDGYNVDDALRTLREIPFDLREWRIDNTHRKDYALRGKDRFDRPQMDVALPYDEIRTFWWNGSPYSLADGGDGRSLQGPLVWLIPYWSLRYAGVITE